MTADVNDLIAEAWARLTRGESAPAPGDEDRRAMFAAGFRAALEAAQPVAPTVEALAEAIYSSQPGRGWPYWNTLINREFWMTQARTLLASDLLGASREQEDPYCREENCEFRHWTSGSMPTHQRGPSCPPRAEAPRYGTEAETEQRITR